METSTRLPGAALGSGSACRRRLPSRSPSANHSWSSGWQARTGVPVVGRRTPVALTLALARVLRSVDLPAPVDPATTTSAGAVLVRIRGIT